MIREAEIPDAELIAAIIVEAWQDAYSGIIDESYPESLKKEKFISIMENNINNKSETIFLYEHDGKVKGFISGKELNDKYDCETVGLYILPDYQHSGAGKELLNKMKNNFKTLGCRTMIIWTLKNARNNSFYKKQGGMLLEEKEITIGDKEYPGAGFVFRL